MSQQQDPPTSRRFTEQELDAIGDYLPELRRSLSDQSIVRTYLGIGFVVGLVAQIVGYLLRQSTGGEPFGLVVDLLYALGWALWTGVVVTFFVQVLPEAKRREVVAGLMAYEARQREKAADPNLPNA